MAHMVKIESYKIHKYNYEYGCWAWKWNTRASNEINVPIDKYWTCKCQTLYKYHKPTSIQKGTMKMS